MKSATDYPLLLRSADGSPPTHTQANGKEVKVYQDPRWPMVAGFLYRASHLLWESR